MKLSISNIAWPEEASDEVADLLREEQVTGIEVAPTKLLGPPADATDADINAKRDHWQSIGLPIVAAQALLFGRNELLLFADEQTRRQTLEHLKRVVRAVGKLGAKSQVFGSPKNRYRGTVSMNEAWPIAIEFFRELGETAVRFDTQVVLEANPVEYGADFLTNTIDTLQLVRDIDHPGIALHIDTACMHMAGDDPESIMKEAGPLFRHFHVSERNLGVVGSTPFPHEQFARALRSVDYQGWTSIEMRAPEPFTLDAIKHAIRLVREKYG